MPAAPDGDRPLTHPCGIFGFCVFFVFSLSSSPPLAGHTSASPGLADEPAALAQWVNAVGLEQFTDMKALGGAVWSPDGRFVAYSADTGHMCSTSGCYMGSCDQMVTPASLRKVKGLSGALGSEAFMVQNLHGQRQSLGCHVLAWTP